MTINRYLLNKHHNSLIKYTKILIAASVLFSTIFIVVHMYRKNYPAKQVIGWTPETKKNRNPFKPGIIMDGKPPSNFAISFLDPLDSARISLGAGESRNFLVCVKAADSKNEKDFQPPTFVFMKVFQNNKEVYKFLVPDAKKDERGCIYSATLVAPIKLGSYEIKVEAEFVIYGLKDGKYVPLDDFKTTSKEKVLLNVHK